MSFVKGSLIKTFDLPSNPNASANTVTQGVAVYYNYEDVLIDTNFVEFTLAGFEFELDTDIDDFNEYFI